MAQIPLDNRTGGISLIVDYCLLFGVLFRNPTAGVTTAFGLILFGLSTFALVAALRSSVEGVVPGELVGEKQ